MIKIISILVFSLVPFSSALFGVDGYKDFKFGALYKDVVAKKPCSLKFNPESSEKGVKVYSCTDFIFNDKKTNAAWFFIDDKFKQIAIQVGTSFEQLIGIMPLIVKKYGKGSSPSMAEIAAFNEGKRDDLEYGYDKNTVFLKMYRQGEMQGVSLIYIDPQFEIDAISAGAKGMEKDI